MNKDDFYAECAALLETEHKGESFPYRYRTRWNNRVAGRGRFEGRGLIRVFGNTVHVNLHSPELNATYPDMETALQGLREAIPKTP